MKFAYYDLKNLSAGQIVEVQLSAAANVRLMDNSDYIKYKKGLGHKYIGGLIRTSPYRMRIPRTGHWYVTIDLGGHPGSVNHNVRVLD